MNLTSTFLVLVLFLQGLTVALCARGDLAWVVDAFGNATHSYSLYDDEYTFFLPPSDDEFLNSWDDIANANFVTDRAHDCDRDTIETCCEWSGGIGICAPPQFADTEENVALCMASCERGGDFNCVECQQVDSLSAILGACNMAWSAPEDVLNAGFVCADDLDTYYYHYGSVFYLEMTTCSWDIMSPVCNAFAGVNLRDNVQPTETQIAEGWCSGGELCGAGTTWDDAVGKCVINYM